MEKKYKAEQFISSINRNRFLGEGSLYTISHIGEDNVEITGVKIEEKTVSFKLYDKFFRKKFPRRLFQCDADLISNSDELCYLFDYRGDSYIIKKHGISELDQEVDKEMLNELCPLIEKNCSFHLLNDIRPFIEQQNVEILSKNLQIISCNLSSDIDDDRYYRHHELLKLTCVNNKEVFEYYVNKSQYKLLKDIYEYFCMDDSDEICPVKSFCIKTSSIKKFYSYSLLIAKNKNSKKIYPFF